MQRDGHCTSLLASLHVAIIIYIKSICIAEHMLPLYLDKSPYTLQSLKCILTAAIMHAYTQYVN